MNALSFYKYILFTPVTKYVAIHLNNKPIDIINNTHPNISVFILFNFIDAPIVANKNG